MCYVNTLLLVFIIIVAINIDAQVVLQYRIIGGEETTINKYPYAISISYHDNLACGGSIIGSYHVLSAAHCFYRSVRSNPTSIHRYFQIHAGISEVDTEQRVSSTIKTKLMLAREEKKEYRNVYTIDYVKLHPEYDDESLTSDIAIIRVQQAFTFNELIQPIELPPIGFQIPVGGTAEVIGWGLTEYEGNRTRHLQTVNVTVLDMDYCVKSYTDMERQITETMFCAGDSHERHDACSGDSGGALSYRSASTNDKLGKSFVIGIVSWGYKCADLHHPGVYTNVALFVNWILDVIKILN